jgi:hypothetical protein
MFVIDVIVEVLLNTPLRGPVAYGRMVSVKHFLGKRNRNLVMDLNVWLLIVFF